MHKAYSNSKGFCPVHTFLARAAVTELLSLLCLHKMLRTGSFGGSQHLQQSGCNASERNKTCSPIHAGNNCCDQHTRLHV